MTTIEALDAPVSYIGHQELKAKGGELTTEELLAAIDIAWRDIRTGRAHGDKAVLALAERDFWQDPRFAGFKQDFLDQRLGWKLSSLYSVSAEYAAVKVIGANAFNRLIGLPRSKSTIILLDKMTMRPLAILDGTAISARRTGTYASLVFRRCFSGRQPISAFLFGAGPIAESVIECLGHVGAGKIDRIFVRSRHFDHAVAMVERCQQQTALPLSPVADNSRLAECALAVTATNARQPVFADEELSPEAVTLHLGGDEVPTTYLQRVLRTGTLVCDSIAMVSHRASQSLALYFERKGMSLETVGGLLGVRELSAATDWYPAHGGPLSITCVGLPMLDLYAAQATFEKYRRNFDAELPAP